MLFPVLEGLWGAIKSDSTVREVVAGVMLGVGQVVASTVRRRGRDKLHAEVAALRHEVVGLRNDLTRHVRESDLRHASDPLMPAVPE